MKKVKKTWEQEQESFQKAKKELVECIYKEFFEQKGWKIFLGYLIGVLVSAFLQAIGISLLK